MPHVSCINSHQSLFTKLAQLKCEGLNLTISEQLTESDRSRPYMCDWFGTYSYIQEMDHTWQDSCLFLYQNCYSSALLLTPARYKCRGLHALSASPLASMMEEISSWVDAGTNKTSPFCRLLTDSLFTVITPLPYRTRKIDGPGTGGKVTIPLEGRMQWSTSNSSKGGEYLDVNSSTGTPSNISGKP